MFFSYRPSYQPRLEVLESRLTPGVLNPISNPNPLLIVPEHHYVAYGEDSGNLVNVYLDYSTLVASFLPFDPGYTAGVRVAVGDVNGDGYPDIIVATGPGVPPLVKVIDGTKLKMVDSNGEISDAALLGKFYAYDPRFLGGVFVATGEVELGVNTAVDIITGADAGGGPHVKVIDDTKLNQLQTNGEIADSALFGQFYAFDPKFSGGVRVADAGGSEIVTGAGPGGGPHVKVIDATQLTSLDSNSEPVGNALKGQFYAYAPSFTGGVYVAANPYVGIVTGAGAGNLGTRVRVISDYRALDNNSEPTDLLGDFYAFDPAFGGGVRVAAFQSGAANGHPSPYVVTGAGPGGGPHIKTLDGTKLSFLQGNGEISDYAVLDQFYAFDPNFTGGVFVGAN
jgi:hypothetical protein